MDKNKLKYIFISFNLHIFYIIFILLFCKIHQYIDELTYSYNTFFIDYVYDLPIIIVIISFIINLIFIKNMGQK